MGIAEPGGGPSGPRGGNVPRVTPFGSHVPPIPAPAALLTAVRPSMAPRLFPLMGALPMFCHPVKPSSYPVSAGLSVIQFWKERKEIEKRRIGWMANIFVGAQEYLIRHASLASEATRRPHIQFRPVGAGCRCHERREGKGRNIGGRSFVHRRRGQPLLLSESDGRHASTEVTALQEVGSLSPVYPATERRRCRRTDFQAARRMCTNRQQEESS